MSRRRDGFAGWSPALDHAPYWSDPVIPPDIDRERCARLTCAGTVGLCDRPTSPGGTLCLDCREGHGGMEGMGLEGDSKGVVPPGENRKGV